MSRSRFLSCLGGAAVCGAWASAGLAYHLGPGRSDKVLVGGALIGTCCIAAVCGVWSAGRLARGWVVRPGRGAAADGGGMADFPGS